MIRRTTILILAFSLTMAATTVAEATALKWAAADGLLPEDSTPSWTLTQNGIGTSTLVTEGADAPYLNINTMDDGDARLYYTMANPVLDTYQDLTFGLAMRLTTYTATDIAMTATVAAQDGESTYAYYTNLFFLRTKVGLYAQPSTKYYSLDTSQWHSYTIGWDYTNKQVSLYIDGGETPVLGPFSMKREDFGVAMGSQFYWGDASNGFSRRGNLDVKYILAPDIPLFPGDANRDLVVDENDAAILAANWLAGSATWSMGDFNKDQVVDDKDATLMAINWHHGMAASVPEPSTAVLLCALVTLLFLRRQNG